MRQGVAAFENPGAFDDPVGIKSKTGVQVFIADHRIRHITPGADDLNPHQSTTAWPRSRRTLGIHGSWVSLEERGQVEFIPPPRVWPEHVIRPLSIVHRQL